MNIMAIENISLIKTTKGTSISALFHDISKVPINPDFYDLENPRERAILAQDIRDAFKTEKPFIITFTDKSHAKTRTYKTLFYNEGPTMFY